LDALRLEHRHPLGGGANHVEESRLPGAGLADHHRCAAAATPSVVQEFQQTVLLRSAAVERRALLD
jgi:hypothetical protein